MPKSDGDREAIATWRRRYNPTSYHLARGVWMCDGCECRIDGEHEPTCPVGGREHNIVIRQAAGEFDKDSAFYEEGIG